MNKKFNATESLYKSVEIFSSGGETTDWSSSSSQWSCKKCVLRDDNYCCWWTSALYGCACRD